MSAARSIREPNSDWQRLAQRFVALSPEQRPAFLAALEERGIPFDRLPITPFADGAPDRLAPAQRRLWFLWRLDPESHAYNLGGALRLEGTLDEAALERALTWLIARHDTLRTSFASTDDGGARPVVHPPSPVFLQRADIADRDPTLAATAARELAEEGIRRPFDLVAGPLVRVGLVRVGTTRHLLWLALHHIVADGWSMEILIDELLSAYGAFRSGQTPSIPAPPIRYADYAAWQQVRMEAGELQRQLAWWTAELGSDHAPLALPTDRPRPSAQSFRGARLDFSLDDETSRALRALARAEGATLFMVLLAALHAFLGRLTGQDDIRIGVSSANRVRPETERLPGFFVTTQVVRARPAAHVTFRELLATVREKALAAQARPDVPFDTLVEALQPARSLSHNPLFQVKFTQQLAQRSLRVAGLEISPVALVENATHFDLSLDVTDTADGVAASLTYATDLFDKASAQRFVRHYADLVGHLVRHPGRPLGDWRPAEPARLSGGTLECPASDILSAFAAQVDARPDASAIQAGAAAMSFAALDAASDRLAHVLVARGIKREDVVLVLCGRSQDLVVALLGIMKAGGVYAPLDPGYPIERLRRLTKDSKAVLGLFDAEGAKAAAGLDLPGLAIAEGAARPLPQGRVPFAAPLPEQAAYLIYTSGSTGAPKGVVVPHRAIASYVQSALARLAIDPQASFGLLSTPAADLGHTMLFGALVSGRTLHLIEADAAFDADRLADIVQARRIGVLKLVPGHLEGLLATPRGADLLPETAVILGGEALSTALVETVRRLKPGCRVINHYGPTETSVGVLAHEPATLEGGGVPIGRPFAHVEAVILDGDLNPALPGALGELYIGGPQVARGYLGRPAATAERFVPDPERPGERLYRTGDVVRLDAQGAITFIGRRDDQIKIRGHRVELREVAQALRALEGVSSAQAVVAKGEAGNDRLVAYIVASQAVAAGAPAALATILPDHMVPAEVIALEHMPLTPNGKLDRAALPAARVTAARPAAVRSEAERVLLSICGEVLRRTDVTPGDNFFALGGDSILSLQVIARAKRQGFRLTPRQVFECKTIAGLAEVAQRLAATAPKPAAVESRPDAERVLLSVCGEVLRRTDVGPGDNFFALGGDSILSLQVIARAKRQGFRLTPRQVFECKTIAGLAEVAQPLAAIAPKPAAADGGREVPLTPIQAAFFARPVPNRAHWCQSVLLTPPSSLDPDALAAALGALVARHEALRLRFSERDGRWTQRLAADSAASDLLWRRSFTDAAGLCAACDEVQRSLDITKGPLLRALLAEAPDGSRRVLIAIHHLAVDGVSWRVLLDDLALALAQRADGQAITLAPPETTFSSLAQRLFLHAHGEDLRQELDYWRASAGPATAPSSTRLADAYARTQRIDDQTTRRLTNAVDGARLHGLMIAALVRALGEGSGDVRLWLEGHGRETPFGFDLSRTVGWLTSIYPVRIGVGTDAETTLRGVREVLAAVPHGGIGHGLLCHLGAPELRAAVAAPPGPVFNYLGRFDSSFADPSGFALAVEDKGAERDPEAPMLDPLRIDARVQDGALRIDWLFDPARYDEAAARHLTAAFERELRSFLVEPAKAGIEASVAALETYPLSPMQQGLLFHRLVSPEDTAYVNLLAVTLKHLDVERFKQAWRAAFARHDILRTTFQWQDGAAPRQIVWPVAEPAFAEHDWRGASDLEDRLARLGADERRRSFDLALAPPMRFVLVRIGDDAWRFFWVRHHILLDGWSSARLLAEVAALYRGQQPARPAPRFRTYIDWLDTRDASLDKAFWREALKSVDEPFRLAGEGVGEAGHARHVVLIDEDRAAAIRAAARTLRVTVNTLVQAAWALTLARRAGRAALFGVTVAGRPEDLPEAEEALGLFINTLPVLSEPRPDIIVADYLAGLQTQNIALREHQYTPLFDIQASAAAGREELFDSVIIFENYPIDEELAAPAPGALAFSDPLVDEDTHYALTLMVEAGARARLTFGYATDRLTAIEVAALAAQFERALSGMIEDPTRPLGSICLAAPDDVLAARGAERQSFRSVLARLGDLVGDAADRTALSGPDGQLSYAGLVLQADRVAARLATSGVGRGDRVGLFVPRGVAMVVGLLGILKAGAGYVPLDPDYPADRLAFMAADVGLKALLLTAELHRQAPTGDWAAIDLAQARLTEGQAPDPVALTENDLAYVIYTSGSTGRPKGVMIGHGALANLLQAFREITGFTASDRLVAVTSLSFDIAGLELLLPLVVGATLTIASREQAADARQLAGLLERAEATILQATPSTWRQLKAIDWPGRFGLKALCGGEAMPPDLATWLRPRVGELWNVYGPTETTIWSTAGRVDAVEGAVPIGRPIVATSLHILDDALQPVPLGSPGELFIGGAGLARGYYGRPGLTAERFVPDPFGEAGARLYRTGDLARWLPDGRIECLARIDQQVKIRGHRVESGEVEAALLSHPAIAAAAVAAFGGSALHAYVVTADEVSDAAIEAHLESRLPGYMMPSAIIRLDRLPMTPNGKVDRGALPAPERVAADHEEPKGEIETAIAAIWADLLSVPRVGRADDFFRLGGHSLTATRMIARLESEQGVVVPLRTLFEAPTLKAFAAAVGTTQGSDAKLARLDDLLAEFDA
ncbi:non-ribosomal peptide synthase domain TIGR01720/amino acid adenylation domain-containing protein [Arboricoccus pini]|uniref:Non-ribosomal peptide synthase domain TIGR01720/amino acid adenylation domain-containing protein n=1 Tax=Arboricoccus pini TaxID=1963835 RepID=A0A212RLP1_9PROT|nr:non-ribosomal peptide synthetase [Arboricoccus pini]SNB73378.1 non-ribosomal peptide synthase domain TIGR01720/amino acid adenylation domain-containing protein [Arboricoccus pini]